MTGFQGLLYCLAFFSSLALLKAELFPTGCCPGPDVLPPRPRVVLLGETGVGKSALGNRLFGNKPGMCVMNNSFISPDDLMFGEGDGWKSKTNETAWMAGAWMGDTNNTSCITVIDTPGVGDSEGRDCVHGVDIGKKAKDLSPIDAFVLIFKGAGMTRFTDHLQKQLAFYNELFGDDFWNNMIIEVSFWRSRETDKEDRLDEWVKNIDGTEQRGKDEAWLARTLNHELSRMFDITTRIPVVFVDPMFGDRRREKPEELETFKIESEKTWRFINSGNSFACDSNCKSPPGFLEGKPTLVSEPLIKARIDDKVVLEFKVWFSGCDGQGDRSYDIYKDGVKICTVVDEQGEERTREKPIELIKNDATPMNMTVIDRCSKTKGSRQNQCNHEKSKYKTVRVEFNKIVEDNYGTYYVNNTLGGSEQVLVEKMVDGFWSDWSQWGKWDKVRKANVRTRVCTPPVNGGAPCPGEAEEECNPPNCPEPSTFGKWQVKCKQACSNPGIPTEEIRERTCTDSTPRHQVQNCDAEPLREFTGHQCSGTSRVDMCPVMTEITTKVCNEDYAGTDDNIVLEFENFNGANPEKCNTEHLGKSGTDDWERGMTQEWGGEHLMTCFKSTFRPINGLKFRFHSNTLMVNLHIDELQLCEVIARFGTEGEPGYSKWRWTARKDPSGSIYQSIELGWYDSMSRWAMMEKIEG